MDGFPVRKVVIGIVVVFVLMFGWWFVWQLGGTNNFSDFQIWQGVMGKVEVIDQSGFYWRNFGRVWTYPKNIQEYYSKSPKEGTNEDDSIRVTFNDGGNASISTFVQCSFPLDKDKRLRLHEKFGGNLDNIRNAIHAHLSNCIKTSGPLMSATENQAARKAEFAQVIEDQLRNGLFQMKRVNVQLKDRVDEKGQPVFVEATEIVKNDKGIAMRADTSPLEEYGIIVNQFSITATDYDEKTLAQFAAKQEAFLNAEKSKAQREEEIQKKLYVMSQGERQAAEETAKGNVAKATLVVQAQTKVAVAMQEKEAAETAANQKLSVAKIEKEAAETKAQQESQVATIAAEREKTVLVTQANAAKDAAGLQSEADKLKATGVIALAEAKQKEISLGGAVRASDQILATIQKERDVEVAKSLASIAVPANIIISNGGGEGKGGGIDPFLFNLNLLKGSGLLNMDAKPFQAKPIEATPAPAAAPATK